MSQPEGLSVVATPEEKMLYYSQKALPESIAEISRNHENLTPVIEWLENAYLTSDTSPATQSARENEAKMYLTDALGAVVENINVISSQLDDLVNLQMDAVDGLTTQINQIKTRLQVCKAQHGANRLRTLRTNVTVPSTEFSKAISIDNNVLPTPGTRMESLSTLYSAPPTDPYQRVPLQSRMSKYDNVGVCLQRENAPNEAGRRKSVPGITPMTPSQNYSSPSHTNQTAHLSMALGTPGVADDVSPSHASMSITSPSYSGGDPSSLPPPPLSSRPPPKLSSVSGPPPPLSRRINNTSGGG